MKTEHHTGEYKNTLTRGEVTAIRALGISGQIATSFREEPDGSMIITHTDAGGEDNQNTLLNLAKQARVPIKHVNPVT